MLGHGEAFDFGVVAAAGGLAGEEGWALGGGAFDMDQGEVFGVEPAFAVEEVRGFAAGFEVDEDAAASVVGDGAGLRGRVVVGRGEDYAGAVGGGGHLFFVGENVVDDDG